MQCDLPAAGLVPTEVSIRPWEKIYVAETGHGPVLGHDGPVKPENLSQALFPDRDIIRALEQNQY